MYLPDNKPSGSEVYSLKNDSWRRLPDCPYNLLYKRAFAMLVSGALHWLVTSKAESDRTNLILAFDLGIEEYRLVPHPDISDIISLMNVGVLGGCLTIYCSHPFFPSRCVGDEGLWCEGILDETVYDYATLFD